MVQGNKKGADDCTRLPKILVRLQSVSANVIESSKRSAVTKSAGRVVVARFISNFS